MSSIKIFIETEITFKINEAELRALDALVGYGYKSFLKVFYEKMGKAYLEPHANGLKTFFDSVDEMRPLLGKIDAAKKILSEKPRGGESGL